MHVVPFSQSELQISHILIKQFYSAGTILCRFVDWLKGTQPQLSH